jgi:small subunit ribosomal protein S18
MTTRPQGGPRGPGGPPGQGRPRGGRRYFPPRRRVCTFCAEKKSIDYKEVSVLRRFLSLAARIETRRRTGTCARHQRQLSQAIKRARLLALLPFTPDHLRAVGWRI